MKTNQIKKANEMMTYELKIIKGFMPYIWLNDLKKMYVLHKGRTGFKCAECKQHFKAGCHYIGGGRFRKLCPRCFNNNFDLKMKETFKQVAEWVNFLEETRIRCDYKKVNEQDMMAQLK